MFVFNVFGIFASNNDKRMLDLEEIRKELGNYAYKCDDSINYSIRIVVEKWAINHFGKLPYLNQLTDSVFDFHPRLEYEDESVVGYDDKIPVYDDDCTSEDLREKRHNVDIDKTLKNVIKAYPDCIEYYYKAGKVGDAIIFHDDFVYFDGIFYTDSPTIPQKIYDCIEEKESKPRIRWILRNRIGSIENKHMDILPKGEIEGNYNDDFYPIAEKIEKLIHSNESSIIILHGKPGTGKTSYIRDLISNNTDVKFYWIDSSMFNYIDTSEFIEFISSCKNAVFVLEDSEVLLTSRDESRNPAMQSLLSISDGMLGDSLKLKFICTFNTDLKNIDDAILRKGRLKVKYEFKDLKTNKVKKLFEKLGISPELAKPMPLCDVYNYLEDNGNNPTHHKIGF